MSSSFWEPDAPVAATLRRPADTAYVAAQTGLKVNLYRTGSVELVMLHSKPCDPQLRGRP